MSSFVFQCYALTFRFLVDKSYLKVQIATYDICFICSFVIQNHRHLVCKNPFSKLKVIVKKLVLYRFLRTLNFQQVIFQKILFKSVYILVTTFPKRFFGSYLCLESKTIFIFDIALMVWSKTKCTTHQAGILSVRDIIVEVSKIIEGKPFITIFY